MYNLRDRNSTPRSLNSRLVLTARQLESTHALVQLVLLVNFCLTRRIQSLDLCELLKR